MSFAQFVNWMITNSAMTTDRNILIILFGQSMDFYDVLMNIVFQLRPVLFGK